MADASGFVTTPLEQRLWLDDAGGWLVKGITCPFDDARIVYNGNYFCEHWNSGSCEWALAHPAQSKADRAICDALKIDYA